MTSKSTQFLSKHKNTSCTRFYDGHKRGMAGISHQGYYEMAFSELMSHQALT